MHRIERVLWACLLSACGSVAAPASAPDVASKDLVTGQAFTGGSRLRAVLAEASDGTALFLHWWDTQLQAACTFEPSGESDNSWRCMPRPAHTIYDGVHEWFADAQCTEPLLRPDIVPSDTELVQRIDTHCWIARDYFRVGARFTQRAYRKTETGCAPDGSATQGAPLYALERLELDAWVAGHTVASATSGRVVGEQLQASDGSRAPHGLHDLAGGFGCWPRMTVEGLRCLPTDFGWGDRGGVFSDAQCREPAAVSEQSCGGRRDALAYVLFAGAGYSVSAVRRGGERLATVFQQVGDGACAAGEPANVGFAVGEPVSLDDFVPTSLEQIVRPSGLVQTQAHAATDRTQTSAAAARFDELRSDTLGGYACTLAKLPDGDVHCVPPIIESLAGHFSDAQCTQSVWQAEWSSVSVRADLDAVGNAASERTPLPRVERVLTGGESYQGSVYAQRGAACELVSGVPNTRQPYRRFSGEATAADLPALEIIER